MKGTITFKKRILLLAFCLLFQQYNYAQKTGKINYPHHGFSFVIPDNLFGQEADQFFLMSSSSTAGILILSVSQAENMQAVKQELDQLIDLGDELSLTHDNNIQDIDDQSFATSFSGYSQEGELKAYMISHLGPYKKLIIMLMVTTAEAFTSEHQETVQKVNKSLQFYKPDVSGTAISRWKQLFNDVKLNFIESSSSGSDETYIHLCHTGYFKYESSNSLSISTKNTDMYGNYIDPSTVASASKNNGEGTWALDLDLSGKTAVLILSFNNGESMSYQLSEERNGDIFLDGQKFIRTLKGSSYPPDCN